MSAPPTPGRNQETEVFPLPHPTPPPWRPGRIHQVLRAVQEFPIPVHLCPAPCRQQCREEPLCPQPPHGVALRGGPTPQQDPGGAARQVHPAGPILRIRVCRALGTLTSSSRQVDGESRAGGWAWGGAGRACHPPTPPPPHPPTP